MVIIGSGVVPPLRRKVGSTQDKTILANPLKREKKRPKVGCLASDWQ
jgi:hypothetical protein